MTEPDPSGRAGTFASGLGAGLAQKAIDPVIRAVREELDSARHEIAARVAGARTGAVLTAAGALLALVGLGLAAALAVVLLALALPLWSATAITLVVVLAAAAVLLAAGVRGLRRGVPPVPKDALGEVRDRLAGSRG